jgi:hypothetical protein
MERQVAYFAPLYKFLSRQMISAYNNSKLILFMYILSK